MKLLSYKYPRRHCLSGLVGLLVLLAASGVSGASVWTLAPGLDVAPLENFQLQWKRLERWGIEGALVGRVGKEPGYFIGARSTVNRRERQHWAVLEKQLQRSADGPLRRQFEGRTAVAGGAVPYRAYRYRLEGEPVQQLYHLLVLPEGSYWLYATAVAPLALEKLLPVTEALVRRAHKKAGP